MDLTSYCILAFDVLIVAYILTRFFVLTRRKSRERKRYPRGPLPSERIRDPEGGCGVHGCANQRPHSHVQDLARRLRR